MANCNCIYSGTYWMAVPAAVLKELGDSTSVILWPLLYLSIVLNSLTLCVNLIDTYTRTKVQVAPLHSMLIQPKWWTPTNPSSHSPTLLWQPSMLHLSENKDGAGIMLLPYNQPCQVLLWNNYPFTWYLIAGVFTPSWNHSGIRCSMCRGLPQSGQ